MRFLNPKTDFAFKKIFGSDSSGEILLSFLNAVLNLKSPFRILEVEIIDPYLAPKIQGMKDTYLDVRVKDEQNNSYIIEMQVLNVVGFEKRVLYNACKTYSSQISKGEDYRILTEVIAITITDFIMFDDLEEIINQFKLKDKNNKVYSDDLQLVFVELPKFNKTEDQLTNIIDKWIYFIKTAGDLTQVPKEFSNEPAILHAFEIANKSALSPEELENQEKREIFIQDQRGALTLAKEQGRKEGEKKKALETAENLFAEKMSLEFVMKVTGLSKEELATLHE